MEADGAPGRDDLVALEEIRRLKARYCHLMDRKDWDAFGALFVEDASLTNLMPAVAAPDGSEHRPRRTTHGREAIVASVRDHLAGVLPSHHADTPDIQRTGPTTATGTWSALFLQGPGSIWGYGFYEEEYVLGPTGWRFADVVVDVRCLFGTPSSAVSATTD